MILVGGDNELIILLSSTLRVSATILGSVWFVRVCKGSDFRTSMLKLKMEQFLQSLAIRYFGGCVDGVAVMSAMRWQWSDMLFGLVVMCVISEGLSVRMWSNKLASALDAYLVGSTFIWTRLCWCLKSVYVVCSDVMLLMVLWFDKGRVSTLVSENVKILRPYFLALSMVPKNILNLSSCCLTLLEFFTLKCWGMDHCLYPPIIKM